MGADTADGLELVGLLLFKRHGEGGAAECAVLSGQRPGEMGLGVCGGGYPLVLQPPVSGRRQLQPAWRPGICARRVRALSTLPHPLPVVYGRWQERGFQGVGPEDSRYGTEVRHPYHAWRAQERRGQQL